MSNRSATNPGVAPRVSVLMPVYNCARFVEEAMRSVLTQSLREIELIVIDDGSSDGSYEVIARVAAADGRIVTTRQDNQGVAAATNRALSLASAPYVALFDSDDVMLPDRLSLQADYLDTHPDIAVVGAQWYNADTDGKITGLGRHAIEPDAIHTLMFSFFSLHNPTTTARREALVAVGGWRTTPKHGAQDYELYSRMLSAGYRFANLPIPLLIWRMSPNGLTYGRGTEQTLHCLEVRQRAFRELANRSPAEADRVAETLVRHFPEGNWFDEKAERLLASVPLSEYEQRWALLAAEGRIDALDVAAVSWLKCEAEHVDALATQFERASSPWLANLVLSRAGRRPTAPCNVIVMREEDHEGIEISVLVPTSATDRDLRFRVESALSQLAGLAAEVLVFSTDGSKADLVGLRRDDRLVVVPDSNEGVSWASCLAMVRGRFLAFLEPHARHSTGFLEHAIGTLRGMSNEPSVAVGPPALFYEDFATSNGDPIRNPAPEPRWTRETLLGRDLCSISAFVVKRETVAGLPLCLADIGSMTGWCLARALLALHAPVVMREHRTRIVAPKSGISDETMPTLIKRLVGWYFDSGLGAVPAEYAWDTLPTSDTRARLRSLNRQLAEDALCLHPGNKMLLLRYAARFSARPVEDLCIRTMQMLEPDTVHTTLAAAGRPWSLAALRIWGLKARIWRRSRRLFSRQSSGTIYR